jgi:hypothetical protein
MKATGTHRLFAALLFLWSLPACSSWVADVEPENQLTVADGFSSGSSLQGALTGCYHLLNDAALYGRELLYMADLMGGNSRHTDGSFPDFLEFQNLQIDPSNVRVERFWITTYRAINQLNLILDRADELAVSDPFFSASERDRLKGEAFALRTLCYFELVRFFGLPYAAGSDSPGVPLQLEPVLQIADLPFPVRAGVHAVYDQIRADLAEAQVLLDEVEKTGRLNRSAAVALAARVAFQMGRYEEADQWVRQLLDGGFALTPSPQAFFRQPFNTETIWLMEPITGLDYAYTIASTAAAELLAADSLLLLPRHLDSLAQEQLIGYDLRTDTGAWTGDPLIDPRGNSRKYDDGEDHPPLLRLAEFTLMRAETAARLGDTEAALGQLNHIRRRAMRVVDSSGVLQLRPELFEYRAEDFIDTEALIDAIARERRVELAFEGHYFHDLLRLRRPVQDIPWAADRLRLPIPQRELDANPNLVQNPGY